MAREHPHLTERERIDVLLDELGRAYHALHSLLDSAEMGRPLDFDGQPVPECVAERLARIYASEAA